MSGSTTAVTIGHLVSHYHVRRDHPAPETVRWRLDELTARALPDALGAALTPLLDRSGAEIVLIRRLHAELDLDVSREPSAVARRWASGIGAAMSRTLSADSEEVLRFPAWPHYLARFLVDASANRATDAWQYRPFRGIHALPRSVQLRTAILRTPDDGLHALRLLAGHERQQVLAALGSTEARRVIEALATAPAPHDDGRGLVDALDAQGLSFASESTPWLAALDLLVRAAPAGHHASGAHAQLAVAIATADRVAVREADASWIARIDAVPDEHLAALPPAQRRRLAPLLELPAATRQRITDALKLRSGTSRRHGAVITRDEPATTTFGGLILLLPALAGMALDEAIPDGSPPEASSVLRLLLLAKSGGRGRADAVMGDPLLRALAGVPVGVATADAIAWLRTHGEELVARLTACRLARGAPMEWSVAVTRHRGERVLVISDLPQDRWWAVVRIRDEAARILRARAWPRLLAALGLGGTTTGRIETALGLVRGRTLRTDLDYLALPASWNIPLEVDRALSGFAQSLLREFGRRLPGFAASSPAFVYDSFLDFGATHALCEGRRICHVGRPPLNVVLAMTGITRGVLSAPWLEPARIELFAAT